MIGHPLVDRSQIDVVATGGATTGEQTTVLDAAIYASLSRRRSVATLRTLSLAPSDAVDFSSNDFLSLSTTNGLRSRYLSELAAHPDLPLGSGGSRLLDGNTSYAETLERKIASFHAAPTALLTNSGYDANVAIFSTLPQSDSLIIYDELIHASVHDGMRASRTPTSRRFAFAHNSVESLVAVIEHILSHPGLISCSTSIFVALEAIYSMDGDVAPLEAILNALDIHLPQRIRHNSHLIVDEAHATGVLGLNGRGLVSSLHLESRTTIRLHTFGKALSANGAAILCSPQIKTYLLNYARPLIYTTFLSFPNLALVTAAYDTMIEGATVPLAEKVMANSRSLWRGLVSLRADLDRDVGRSTLIDEQRQWRSRPLLQVDTEEPQSPIFSVRTSDPRGLAGWCQARGFVIRPIVPPTVPAGAERVRVCLHSGNTEAEIKGLVDAMRQWCDTQRTSPQQRLTKL